MSDTDSSRAPDESNRTLSWETCKKNPGHMGFIPVKQFGPEHLPEEYRRKCVMMKIGLIADLTCRVCVSSKSTHRPKNRKLFSDVSKYRYGTGNVIESITKLQSTQKCQICDSLHELTEGFYVIRIKTACHVVFDCNEAENTTIDLFYDDEDNLKDIKKLHGFRMISRNIDEDQSIFECTTADFDLVTLLENKLNSFRKLVSESSFIYSAPCNIIASHPHGMSKHISVGAWREEDQHETAVQSEYCQSFVEMRFSEDSCCLKSCFPTLLEPVLVSNRPESELVSVECEVHYPDGTSMRYQVRRLEDKVRCTKADLIRARNFPGDPDNFYLELIWPDEGTQIMKDDQRLDYYMDDLCRTYRIVVKRNR